MRIAIVVAALCAALVGCVSTVQEPVDWYGDTRFTPLERAEIERGAAWLYEQAGLPRPHIEWSYAITTEVTPRTIRRERGPYGADGATGQCVLEKTSVYLDPIGTPSEHMELRHLAGLTAHELAHCVLGFVDGYREGDAKSDGIMRVLEPMVWSENEREQCRASSNCPSGR